MEYKGDLKGFPDRVVNWMLDMQEKQGNKRDVSVFEEKIYADINVNGFDWDKIDHKICKRIIIEKNFELFDKLYGSEYNDTVYPKMPKVIKWFDSKTEDEKAKLIKTYMYYGSEKKGQSFIEMIYDLESGEF